MLETSSSKHILVVGGSLTGLFCGVALRRLGHRVTILEKSPTPLLHDQGAGVVAGSQTLRWVQKFTTKSQDEISVRSKERLYLDRDGKEIDVDVRSQQMTSWGMLYHLAREQFDQPGQAQTEYRYGVRVESASASAKKIHLRASTDQGSEVIEGDFLIVADGPSSKLRPQIVAAESSSREYAGYVAFRGTVEEGLLSSHASKTFVERFCFYHGSNPNSQILAYTIPSGEHSLKQGQRLINWVWYWNVAKDSRDYDNLMTDKNGVQHRYTLPTGGMIDAEVWNKQKQLANQHLPPQYQELINKTEKPFVQAITDHAPPQKDSDCSVLLDGMAVVVGDALAGFRPHTAASTSQGALHALLLERVFSGQMTWAEYSKEASTYAHELYEQGIKLGQRSQFGHHPLAS